MDEENTNEINGGSKFKSRKVTSRKLPLDLLTARTLIKWTKKTTMRWMEVQTLSHKKWSKTAKKDNQLAASTAL